MDNKEVIVKYNIFTKLLINVIAVILMAGSIIVIIQKGEINWIIFLNYFLSILMMAYFNTYKIIINEQGVTKIVNWVIFKSIISIKWNEMISLEFDEINPDGWGFSIRGKHINKEKTIGFNSFFTNYKNAAIYISKKIELKMISSAAAKKITSF